LVYNLAIGGHLGFLYRFYYIPQGEKTVLADIASTLFWFPLSWVEADSLSMWLPIAWFVLPQGVVESGRTCVCVCHFLQGIPTFSSLSHMRSCIFPGFLIAFPT